MSSIERVLVPGSRELPDCRCGSEMRLLTCDRSNDRPQAETRIYTCTQCQRELRLMVWLEPAVDGSPAGKREACHEGTHL